jgi:hypothetical protein
MRISDTDEYKHLVAQGVATDAAWCAAWVDRAYKYLVTNGLDGSVAYAQAVSLFFANGIDLECTAPEHFVREVMSVAYNAQEKYPTLDPNSPESSKVTQRGNPS